MANQINILELAAELTAAWLANPGTRTDASDAPDFLRLMHTSISQLVDTTDIGSADRSIPNFKPVVSVRKSLASPEYILSLITGEPFKTLRRHLALHGLSPSEYRLRYDLAADYPMVAPSYSERRRTIAKSVGLGQKVANKQVKKTPDAPLKTARKPRPRKAP